MFGKFFRDVVFDLELLLCLFEIERVLGSLAVYLRCFVLGVFRVFGFRSSRLSFVYVLGVPFFCVFLCCWVGFFVSVFLPLWPLICLLSCLGEVLYILVVLGLFLILYKWLAVVLFYHREDVRVGLVCLVLIELFLGLVIDSEFGALLVVFLINWCLFCWC